MILGLLLSSFFPLLLFAMNHKLRMSVVPFLFPLPDGHPISIGMSAVFSRTCFDLPKKLSVPLVFIFFIKLDKFYS